jgi:glycine dehydrogenase subunit 1
MKYLPHTEADRKKMLETIGVSRMEDLFADIPEGVRFKGRLDVPPALSDPELMRHLRELASRNRTVDDYTSYLGGGAYDHFLPSVVDHVASRNEFYTAYTPYQPEVSQGTLQTMYEYQSLMCELLGMDVSNASMYDGATAAAEAALISCRHTERKKAAVAATVHPEWRQVLRTYMWGRDLEVVELPHAGGVTDVERAKALLGPDVACLIVQHPNFFGCLEPVEELEKLAHAAGGLFVAGVDPISLGVLKPPGEYGADFAVGEGQSLGNHLNFGGPYLGFFTCTEKLMRRMPGRISGQTLDANGQRGFVLALATREQHIRREKATSNICSNEALCALAAAVYLTTLGPRGIKHVAELCLHKAHYLHDRVAMLERFKPAFSAPFFKEFVVRSQLPAGRVISGLLEDRIMAGPDVGRFYPDLKDHLLFCVTERRTREELDHLVARLEGSL